VALLALEVETRLWRGGFLVTHLQRRSHAIFTPVLFGTLLVGLIVLLLR
jgi:hypothetical protein